MGRQGRVGGSGQDDAHRMEHPAEGVEDQAQDFERHRAEERLGVGRRPQRHGRMPFPSGRVM